MQANGWVCRHIDCYNKQGMPSFCASQSAAAPLPDVDEVVNAPVRLLLARHLKVGAHHVQQRQVVTVAACELEPRRVCLRLLVPASES